MTGHQIRCWDTYETEPRPVAEHNLVRSLDPMGSRRRAQDELRFDLGDRLPHVWIDRPAGRISSLDLLGPGLTQLSVDLSSPQLNNPSHVPPITGHRLEPLAAAASAPISLAASCFARTASFGSLRRRQH